MVEILRSRGVEFDAIEYLQRPLDRATLARLLDMLDDAPAELVRKDKRFQELGLAAGDYETAERVLSLLIEHPELMQRPVVVRGTRALIARPSERVSELLEDS